MNQYYTYILASSKNWTLYIGVTSDLLKRVYEHKNWIYKWFSSKYWICNLVHFEVFSDIRDAIEREKRLKKWNRNWKLELIESNNPEWKDLYDELL